MKETPTSRTAKASKNTTTSGKKLLEKKTPLPHKNINKCLAVILAIKRILKDKGRQIQLKISIQTNNTLKNMGALCGKK